MKASGELDEILRKWTDGPESEKTMPDYLSLPAENGTLKMVTEGAYAPMSYFRGSEIVGMEIDMAIRFCQANGYGLTVESLNFDGILPAMTVIYFVLEALLGFAVSRIGLSFDPRRRKPEDILRGVETDD